MKGKSYSVDVEGIQVDVPVVYEDLSAVLLLFPAKLNEVKKFIDCERVTPVKIWPDTCLLAITIFDYVKCPTGPYRELALSVPVILDQKKPIPVLPLILESLFSNYGFYTNSLAMNTDIARVHSEKIFGYPTYGRNIEIGLNNQDGLLKINVADGAKHILSISIKERTSYKKIKNKNYNTFFKKNDKLYRVKMTVGAKVASSFFNKDCLCDFGNHEICNTYINKFLLSDKPLYQMQYTQAIEVLSSPVQM